MATDALKTGELYGLTCTDAFGMGVDISDVEIVVQWRLTCDLDTLWQRFGRAARGPGTTAVAVLFVEDKYCDDVKALAAQRAEERKKKQLKRTEEKEQAKRKRDDDESDRGRRKRARGGDREPSSTTSPSNSVEAPRPVETPLSVYESLRVDFTTQARQKTITKKRKSSSEELSPEMDNLVNARWREFKCYRAPIMAFYENDRITSDINDCQEGGCARCTPFPSSICCELCWLRAQNSNASTATSPNPFAMLPDPDAPSDSSAGPRASGVKKDYDFERADQLLQADLHEFRKEKTIQLYGKTHLRNMGPTLVMGNDTLQRIIDCARAHKLPTLDALKKETKWVRTAELGQVVLDIVHRHYPTPNPTSAAASSPAATVRKCSKCGSTSHIARIKKRERAPKNATPTLCANERDPSRAAVKERGDEYRFFVRMGNALHDLLHAVDLTRPWTASFLDSGASIVASERDSM
ncbi:hypothetical protein EIP86_003605 [Pleurotus ostreatoroseus]|nr:hypothetical protein EIP86_003605 [Pleurotus ostreatoroseus]